MGRIDLDRHWALMEGNMPELSLIYADFISELSYDSLPQEVIDRAKWQILDLVGVSLAGYKLMEFPRLVVDYVARMGGTPEATIIQIGRKFPAMNAALANGVCAHALDMDDGHRFAGLHPGAAIIPAAIAAAEFSGASTKTLITGVVVGYEIMIRIGMGIIASSLSRGFHTTGTIGPFGAAAATAKIIGLKYDEIVGALGLAGLQGAGLMQVAHDSEGAKVKPLHPGKAAMAGLLSTLLARDGVRGPSAILEGEDGFLRAMADEVKWDLLTRDLGQQFEINNIYVKFHAACRHTHAAIDAALEAFRSSGSHIDAISRISVETYPVALKICGTTHPATPSEGRFSIPFSVALALTKGNASADKYSEENVKDADIQNLAGKVQLATSDKWVKLFPSRRGATVSITTSSGKVISAEVELARGEPENPATWDDVYNKFRANASLLLPEDDVEKLGIAITNLEMVSLSQLIQSNR